MSETYSKAATGQDSTYDLVPYPSKPFCQTHPDRLATIGHLFGLTPPPVNQCRVLEIGCASGDNIIPMGEQLPGSQFLGIDLSEHQITKGRKFLVRTGLQNVELRHANILDIDRGFGTFDYIIAHGVYSWVPRPVQDKILLICADLHPGRSYQEGHPTWTSRVCAHIRASTIPADFERLRATMRPRSRPSASVGHPTRRPFLARMEFSVGTAVWASLAYLLLGNTPGELGGCLVNRAFGLLAEG